VNHSFIAAPWNQKICRGYPSADGKVIPCLQIESAHGKDVTCESCNNVGEVELFNRMLLCASCVAKEIESINKPSIEQIESLSIEQTLNQVNRILETNQIANGDGEAVKDIIDAAIAGNIKEYKDFFNAKIPSIMSLKETVESDNEIPVDKKHYAVMSLLKRRVQYLAMVLFQTRNSQIEIGAEMKSIQFYMAETIPKLRMKLRAEFALNTPNYTPQVIKSGVPKERKGKQSPSDKIASMYAKSMKISIDEAKKIIERGLRENCTCNETPGMCKVHNS
jgi:hypothetical protein